MSPKENRNYPTSFSSLNIIFHSFLLMDPFLFPISVPTLSYLARSYLDSCKTSTSSGGYYPNIIDSLLSADLTKTDNSERFNSPSPSLS
jgi:hypothetical protein